jgi:hypothetical protein
MITPEHDSVFADLAAKAWPYIYEGTLIVRTIAGGTPSDPKVAEGWLRTKLVVDKAGRDDLIREAVTKIMLERGIAEEDLSTEAAKKKLEDEAIAQVDANKHLNGFKWDKKGLYIEGRQLKAALKEATSVAYSTGKVLNAKGVNSFGLTKKGIHGFFAEHVMVVEEKLYLGITREEFAERAKKGDGCGVMQRFVHTFRGAGIQYEEYVENAKIDFTIKTDHEFTREQWGMIWLTGQEQGIGASRSQGFGKYTITRWEKR